MRAIILAAGRGSRLKALTDKQPKCLLKIHGKSLLEYQIEALSKAGITNIAIVTGYLANTIQHPSIDHYFHNPLWSRTNMVYSLTRADDWLSESDCIISYADIFYQPSAIESLMKTPHAMAITYDVNFLGSWRARFAEPLDDLENFLINEEGFVKKIGGKPASFQEVMGQYMGLIKCTPAVWSKVTALIKKMPKIMSEKLDMTSLLSKLIEEGSEQIKAIPYSGVWGEVDNENDYILYKNVMKKI